MGGREFSLFKVVPKLQIKFSVVVSVSDSLFFFTDPDLDPTQKPKAHPDLDPGGKGKRFFFRVFFHVSDDF